MTDKLLYNMAIEAKSNGKLAEMEAYCRKRFPNVKRRNEEIRQQEMQNLLEHVQSAYFPELKKRKFSVRRRDDFAGMWIFPGLSVINYSQEVCDFSDEALIGGIAHELSHEVLGHTRFLKALLDSFVPKLSIKSQNEANDEVSRRGLGDNQVLIHYLLFKDELENSAGAEK